MRVLYLLLPSLLFAGPALASDDGRERTDELIEKIERAEKEMSEARKRVEKALEAYRKTLRRDEAGKRRSAYKDLKKTLERCEEKTKALRERHKDMDKEAAKYFKAWKKSLKNIESGDLKARSERRLRDARNHYESVSNAWHAMMNVYQPMTRRLEDQAIYLGHDLNAGSAESLSEDAAKLESFAGELFRMMDGFASEARAYVSSLRS